MLRFRVSTILILVVVFTVTVAVGSWLYRSWKQAHIVSHISDCDGSVLYQFQVNSSDLDSGNIRCNGKFYPDRIPKFLIDSLGHDYFCTVVSVQFPQRPDEYDREISIIDSELATLTQLRSLDLRGFWVSKSSAIEDLTQLRVLRVSKISPKAASKLTELRELHLDEINSEVTRNFPSNSKLESLTIANCSSLESFEFLKSMKKLRKLHLHRYIDPPSDFLQSLESVTNLTLNGTGARLKEGSLPPNLRTLKISDSQVSNLLFLSEQSQLQEILIDDTTIRKFPSFLSKLQKISIQDCNIHARTAPKAFPSLKAICIERCLISDRDFIGDFHQVEELSVSLSSPLNTKKLRLFSNLKHLSLMNERLTNFEILTELTKLEFFETNQEDIDPKKTKKLLKSKPGLLFFSPYALL